MSMSTKFQVAEDVAAMDAAEADTSPDLNPATTVATEAMVEDTAAAVDTEAVMTMDTINS